jgi:hypothetical protein
MSSFFYVNVYFKLELLSYSANRLRRNGINAGRPREADGKGAGAGPGNG